MKKIYLNDYNEYKCLRSASTVTDRTPEQFDISLFPEFLNFPSFVRQLHSLVVINNKLCFPVHAFYEIPIAQSECMLHEAGVKRLASSVCRPQSRPDISAVPKPSFSQGPVTTKGPGEIRTICFCFDRGHSITRKIIRHDVPMAEVDGRCPK